MIGANGKIDEAGSLGEVSRACAPGRGDGITSGATGWTTVPLKPGHYAAGMYTELDVTGRHPPLQPVESSPQNADRA